jgi:glutathione S-transferase
MALVATGIPFETICVRLRKSEATDDILRHSPSGKVPLLKTGDGERIWDSLAICETLAERHPAAKLWPDDAKVRALARSYCAEMHAGFPDLRDQLTMDFARQLPLPELRPETGRQIERIIAAWEEALSAHEGGFLFGRFSIADCMYAPVMSRFRTYGVALPAASATYAKRVWQLPAMQSWLKEAEAEVAAGLP